jgi:hypothetical protein
LAPASGPIKSVCYETSQKSVSDPCQCPANIKPEFIDIVLNELSRLTCGLKPPQEIVFPANLCSDELAFLACMAADRGCRLDIARRGAVRCLKVVRLAATAVQ